jgi:hypothetical protein
LEYGRNSNSSCKTTSKKLITNSHKPILLGFLFLIKQKYFLKI